MAAKKSSYLTALDVYGFDRVEPAILSALVTEDPLLLIGQSGTGKTFLLNSLSEELGLEHRHYNASLISFDDLVGFPYPDNENGGVKFLETPATVWGAESVLIDEISRCKPEHQNRLFSLIYERRVQGILIEKLRFRWAAMNPSSTDQGGLEEYAGSEPLDPALADRFGLLIWASDWDELSDRERRKIADPGGEGRISADGGRLKRQVEVWRAEFQARVNDCPGFILEYVTHAVTALNGAGVRVSPRRSRLLARSLLAATIVKGRDSSALFKLILSCSLPHAAWVEPVKKETVNAAHRAAWDSATEAKGSWVHAFMAEQSLSAKLGLLLDKCESPDEGSQAVAQFLATEEQERAAVFAFAVYPAAALGKLPVGAEGVNDLGKVAAPMLSVDGTISWAERLNQNNTNYPDFERFARVTRNLRGARRERAQQFFNWCSTAGKLSPADPGRCEAEINACVSLLKKRGRV